MTKFVDTNQLHVWDFTIDIEYLYKEFLKLPYPTDLNDEKAKQLIARDQMEDMIKEFLIDISNCWCFQMEKGKINGRYHYQGRMKLPDKNKKRKSTLINMQPLWSWTPTSNKNKNNMFYVQKEDTRIVGPWKDTDACFYLPKDLKDVTKLLPWQEDSDEMMKDWYLRLIRVYLGVGNDGKSTYCRYKCATNKKWVWIPPCDSQKQLMEFAYAEYKGKKRADWPEVIMFDIPKDIEEKQYRMMFTAIEIIKSGWVYDGRYTSRKMMVDPPNIIVFANKVPYLKALTPDKWSLWKIQNKELVEYDPEFELKALDPEFTGELTLDELIKVADNNFDEFIDFTEI